jgi:hypothetical protein
VLDNMSMFISLRDESRRHVTAVAVVRLRRTLVCPCGLARILTRLLAGRSEIGGLIPSGGAIASHDRVQVGS